MEMMKQVNRVWKKPQRVSFVSEYEAENPCFTEDGSRMYFTSTRPIKTEGVNIEEKFWRENIWYVDKEKEGWSEPVPLNSDVNSFDIHWEISINDLNKNLYFSTSSGEMGGVTPR